MEKRDLYNSERKLIGKTINKDEAIPANTYILVVAIVLQNSKNEFCFSEFYVNNSKE